MKAVSEYNDPTERACLYIQKRSSNKIVILNFFDLQLSLLIFESRVNASPISGYLRKL